MARSGGAKIKHGDGRIELVEGPTRPAWTEIDGLPEEERAAAIERHQRAAQVTEPAAAAPDGRAAKPGGKRPPEVKE